MLFQKKALSLHPHSYNAQMAESVDALVSNTSGATHPGSTPGLGTKNGEFCSPFFLSKEEIPDYRYLCNDDGWDTIPEFFVQRLVMPYLHA